MNNEQWKVTWLSRNWLLALLLLAATFVAYQPVWRIGYMFGEGIDNDLYSLQGLGHIWTEQGQSTPGDQPRGTVKGYYPLTFTTFWLEYHLWGRSPLGYHLDNVLLQGLNAIILWLVLRRLSVPGAWLGAAIWALHPVNVESVAWIEERKNTLSGLFYLCSLLAALKYWLPEQVEGQCSWIERPATDKADNQNLVASAHVDGLRGPVQFYWVALALFVLSLLSKTTAIPMPVVVLLLIWWKRGRILLGDVRPLLIFAVLGIATGLDTMHVEHNMSAFVWQGNFSKEFTLPLVDRFLIAGRDVWFYLGKLIWPHPLIFEYPLWKMDPLSAMAWLQLLAAPLLLWLLWLKRRSWGRPSLVALLYFLFLLAPVLGFFNAIFFRRSFVADHYQYLACMGPLALAAAGIVMFSGQLGKAGRVLKPLLSVSLVSILGVLTWSQCRIYAGPDPETLYRTTLALNPDEFTIHDGLGLLLLKRGQLDAGIEQLRLGLKIYSEARVSCQLANALLDAGKPDEAMIYFHNALQMRPDYASAYDGLGHACLASGRTDEAIQNFQKALQINPGMPMACYYLGNAYIQKKQLDLAIECWQKVVTLEPGFAPAHANLGNAFLLKGQIAEAIQQWQSALASDPNMESAQVNLAWVLATCPQASLRNGTEAEQLAERADGLTGGRDSVVLRTLAAACAENGDFANAMAADRAALQFAAQQGNKQLAADIQGQMKFYENNQPFRDTSMMAH